MKELFFTNEKDETFFLQVALPSGYLTIEEVAVAQIPILFCVHGAGMSGDNFLLLSRELSHPTEDETIPYFRGTSVPIPESASRLKDRHCTEGETFPPSIGNHNSPSAPFCRQAVHHTTLPLPRTPSTAPLMPHSHTPFFLSSGTGSSNGEGKMPSPPQLPPRPPLSPVPIFKEVKEDVDPEVRNTSTTSLCTLRTAQHPLTATTLTDDSSERKEISQPFPLVGSGIPSRVFENERKTAERGATSATPLDPSAGSSSNCGSSPFQAVCTVMYDMRCHGRSTFAGGEGSLTLDVLVEDFLDVLRYIVEKHFPKNLIFVLGHSLGAAVVAAGVGGASRKWRPSSPLGGVILLDAVEGTSKLALQSMLRFIEQRPEEFDTVKEAEHWFLHHGGMRTVEGAAISVPPLLRPVVLATPSLNGHQSPTTVDPPPCEDKRELGVNGEKEHPIKYTWRSRLPLMSTVWNTWFEGLDENFLRISAPKMLCVASVDRLDHDLTVAHMQGKFQLEICGNRAGHYIQDDTPAELAAKVRRLVKRTIDVQKILKGGGIEAASASGAS